jgi:hypothetical protein
MDGQILEAYDSPQIEASVIMGSQNPGDLALEGFDPLEGI